MSSWEEERGGGGERMRGGMEGKGMGEGADGEGKEEVGGSGVRGLLVGGSLLGWLCCCCSWRCLAVLSRAFKFIITEQAQEKRCDTTNHHPHIHPPLLVNEQVNGMVDDDETDDTERMS